MAILVDFAKTWEDDDRVEYVMGVSPRLDDRMVIDKRTKRGAPANGVLSLMFRTAYYRILELQEETGTWPAEGTAAA